MNRMVPSSIHNENKTDIVLEIHLNYEYFHSIHNENKTNIVLGINIGSHLHCFKGNVHEIKTLSTLFLSGRIIHTTVITLVYYLYFVKNKIYLLTSLHNCL